jgi:hypothetical protein
MVVLVEGPSRRSSAENPKLTGRSDTNHRCVFPDLAVPLFDRGRDSIANNPNLIIRSYISKSEYDMIEYNRINKSLFNLSFLYNIIFIWLCCIR